MRCNEIVQCRDWCINGKKKIECYFKDKVKEEFACDAMGYVAY